MPSLTFRHKETRRNMIQLYGRSSKSKNRPQTGMNNRELLRGLKNTNKHSLLRNKAAEYLHQLRREPNQGKKGGITYYRGKVGTGTRRIHREKIG